MELPKVIGHRGAAASAPENTLAGFRRAAALGAPWVEFDTQLSADGRCIVFHDERLGRTTDGRGPVDGASLAAIRRLDAGAWFGSEFTGQRVPTLVEVLALLRRLGLRADIEIKPCEGRERETAQAVMAETLAAWPADAAPPLITSYWPACLEAARQAAPDWPRGLICFRFPGDWQDRLAALGCTVLVCNHERLTRRRVEAIVGAGYPILAFTVNSPRRAATLLRWGVASIISDAPERILARIGGPTVSERL